MPWHTHSPTCGPDVAGLKVEPSARFQGSNASWNSPNEEERHDVPLWKLPRHLQARRSSLEASSRLHFPLDPLKILQNPLKILKIP